MEIKEGQICYVMPGGKVITYTDRWGPFSSPPAAEDCCMLMYRVENIVSYMTHTEDPFPGAPYSCLNPSKYPYQPTV